MLFAKQVLGLLVPIVVVGGIAVLSAIRPAPEQSTFIHSVYFWMNEDVTDAQRQEFKEILEGLSEIESVTRCYVGPAAGTPRKVVDNTYDMALIVHFEDKAGHDLYQEHSLHKAAIERFEPWIRDIRIYDVMDK